MAAMDARAAEEIFAEEEKKADAKMQEVSEGMAGREERKRSDSALEGIYDRMPDISIKALDRFILTCVIALAAVVLAGVLKANHVF